MVVAAAAAAAAAVVVVVVMVVLVAGVGGAGGAGGAGQPRTEQAVAPHIHFESEGSVVGEVHHVLESCGHLPVNVGGCVVVVLWSVFWPDHHQGKHHRNTLDTTEEGFALCRCG